jgi:hypothetical protein
MEGTSNKVTSALSEIDEHGLINLLEDPFRETARLLILGFAMYGYGRIRVKSTKRDIVMQQRYYGLGRTEEECELCNVPKNYAKPAEKKVTWCRPENSKHVAALALDISFSMYDSVPKVICERLSKLLRINWGGNWEVKDYGHFESRS